MTTLGVNIDHIANVRQARKTVEPDPVQFAFLAELGGADSITVHLREDRRHIQDRDVFLLKETIKTKLNLEMAATEEMLEISKKLLPDYVTLVPEKRDEDQYWRRSDFQFTIAPLCRINACLQQKILHL